ncbi:translation factor GUF1 homolog, mitochondrial-like isoform X2 [Dysidea avara]|uniref:translation factor GUF1 homolog, mitochondrial-like isoform X2 n=1 Tax=Dysidea avara TaxID=196820 RepID=UPI0033217B19
MLAVRIFSIFRRKFRVGYTRCYCTETWWSVPQENIRNFCIVAHVDHGKSTLADRLMELTGCLSSDAENQQVLDQLPVERARGITVKAQTVSMPYTLHGEKYLLNLIDTPGHIDFSYEVSRSLAACQGALLLVDAHEGIQAQTVTNYLLAMDSGLSVIPVINKVDLKNAQVDQVSEQIEELIGHHPVHKVSAKYGEKVANLLPAVISEISCPPGNKDSPLRMLLVDCWYERHRGVVCLFVVLDGNISQGSKLESCHTSKSYTINSMGLLTPQKTPVSILATGQVGYITLGMYDTKEALIGDTFVSPGSNAKPLPGFKPSKPVVFAEIYPIEGLDFAPLKSAVEKLILNDASVHKEACTSSSLGVGWRLGFHGLLHMDIFKQRLEEEYDASVIFTAPAVCYKAKLKNGSEIVVHTPSQFPQKVDMLECLEPMVMATLTFPDQYLGKMIQLCMDYRGQQKDIRYISTSQVIMTVKLPLSEMIVDFFDKLKTVSSGYANLDYEHCGYEVAAVEKVEILINGKPMDAMATITHQDKARSVGKSICQKLRKSIPRQLFEIVIQASINNKIVTRETFSRPMSHQDVSSHSH